jgi:hypothetical protein
MTRKWLYRGMILCGGLMALAAGASEYAYSRIAPYARIGATYIAKQDCSCLFVEGRSEYSCTAEFKPDIDRFKVEIDRSTLPAKAKVTTRLAIFSGEATYEQGFGCSVSR